MKYLFVIIYTVISSYPAPCPNASTSVVCAVYHGMRTDTTKVEVMTTDTAKVNGVLRSNPMAKVDTFMLIPYGG